METMTKRDFYEVLDLSKDATENDIKKAYRKLAMEFHPDRNAGSKEAEEKFKEASEAYEVLKDPQKRQRYDQFGHSGLKGGLGGFGGGFDFDVGDALRTFMSDFGFGDILGGRGNNRDNRQRRGRDLQLQLRLTLEEISSGVEKKIRLKKMILCDVCDGRGGQSITTCLQCQGSGEVRQVSQSILGQFVNIAPCPRCHGGGTILKDPCNNCGGEGRVKGEKLITVDIPAGVSSGNYISVRGEGNVGPNGGPSGDAIIVIDEAEHEHFERHGDDILYHLPLSFTQVALGAEIEVPTLDGKSKLSIQAGTQVNKILRMRSKGIARLHGHGRGDQLVRIVVWTPTKLSADDKKLLLELAKSEHLNPPKNDRGFLSKIREAIF